jgi:hypothetical protein
MKKLKPRSINGSSQAVLVGVIAGSVVCLGLIPSVLAQASPNLQLASYVPQSRESRSVPAANTNAVPETKLIKPSVTTPVDRWIVFENEYGIQDKSPSAIGRMIQAAKYGLDRMTFTAQESAKRLEFNCNIGDDPANGPGSRPCAPHYSMPVFGKFGQAQIKSEVTIHDPETGQAFIGFKLSIPFGQGG